MPVTLSTITVMSKIVVAHLTTHVWMAGGHSTKARSRCPGLEEHKNKTEKNENVTGRWGGGMCEDRRGKGRQPVLRLVSGQLQAQGGRNSGLRLRKYHIIL